MSYETTQPRGFTPDQERWLRENALAITQEFASARDFIGLKYLHAAPKNFFAGMIIAADGTDYDPGSGVGIYQRNEANTAWRFVG